MKKIAIVTSTRAEYGILTPLIRLVNADTDLELQLLVTGTHLSMKYGNTVRLIESDGFPIAYRIPILEEGGTEYDASVTMANAVRGFAECFRDDRPDMVVLTGDRTELLGIAAAAVNERIPVAHIHGGEVTQGAVDDCIRHAVTKMSWLHFTAAPEYRNRVIQLGEDPARVFQVGSLGTENILKTEFLSEAELRKEAGIISDGPYALVTFHPVTLEDNTCRLQAEELCKAMEQREDIFFLITMANADAGGNTVNDIFAGFSRGHKNAGLVANLGMVRYLSAVKYAAFVMGNSSSGMLEAPVLGTPTVNIGDRQRGRIEASTVICCEPYCDRIMDAMRMAETREHVPSFAFGNGNTAADILREIKNSLKGGKILLKKEFFDCGFSIGADRTAADALLQKGVL